VARRGTLRASDDDRELIAERLRQATMEGRLAAEELDERLGAALSARTYGELDAVVADLPSGRVEHPRRRSSARGALSIASAHPIVTIAALPFLLAAVAIVAAVVTGLATLWAVWVVFAWLAFGRRGHHVGARRRRHWSQANRGVAGSFTPWL
jgi:hypothetical protein